MADDEDIAQVLSIMTGSLPDTSLPNRSGKNRVVLDGVREARTRVSLGTVDIEASGATPRPGGRNAYEAFFEAVSRSGEANQ